MKIKIIYTRRQVCGVILLLFFFIACNGKKEETPVTPPLTSPLSQAFIGFGVVNVSYTRVTIHPEEDNSDGNPSPGYLRRGAVVYIIERRLIKNQESSESWVLVQGSCIGWLKESFVDIYESEAQAQTASESMGR